jgi:hypothetical protein
MTLNLRSFISDLKTNRRKLTWTIIWAVIGFSLLRSCIVNSQNSLPNEVVEKLQKQYVNCISSQDTPIWPGEPRQPECGTVDIKVLGRGIIPDEQKLNGSTEVICFEATYENPYWSTMGTTRHEVKSSKRTAYQVTVLQNNSWQLFPSDDQADQERWDMYSCPDRE